MLDQLSGGRLELGIGRGASPLELSFFDVTPDDAAEIYRGVVEILLAGADSGRISADGPRFVLRGVPLHLTPVQRPHPPLWYGAARPESARWAAERDVNIVVEVGRPPTSDGSPTPTAQPGPEQGKRPHFPCSG